ncbi:MAG: hypothetical protein D6830_00295 [Ignavibacteria bacterium]|nr:MAG: hypothetical protein D6830_00295 [Ignavibacteria bacterium]
MRRVNLIILLMTFISFPLQGQDAKLDSLRKELHDLKIHLLKIESELNKLSREREIPEAEKIKLFPYRSLKNWRKLEIGMKQSKVKEILGEPTRITAGKYSTIWWYEWMDKRYRIGHASFDNAKKLVLWVEP